MLSAHEFVILTSKDIELLVQALNKLADPIDTKARYMRLADAGIVDLYSKLRETLEEQKKWQGMVSDYDLKWQD